MLLSNTNRLVSQYLKHKTNQIIKSVIKSSLTLEKNSKFLPWSKMSFINKSLTNISDLHS